MNYKKNIKIEYWSKEDLKKLQKLHKMEFLYKEKTWAEIFPKKIKNHKAWWPKTYVLMPKREMKELIQKNKKEEIEELKNYGEENLEKENFKENKEEEKNQENEIYINNSFINDKEEESLKSEILQNREYFNLIELN